ncbi:ABC transporter permease [Pseudonocardia nigra]|uniref:ABC transporter permease n=1 Tax=Pseudonocardia nigra TaxID=1921578 RepID=UPI001C5F82CD|nr:ABC transporter permease [Pseudonocardia nigra]
MGFFEFAAGNWRDVVDAAVAHVVLVVVALALATAIAVPLAVLTYRHQMGRTAVIGVAGVFLTIPSYALFGLLIAPLGLGNAPAVVALTLYALLPIIRNAVVGLRSVDPAVAESARAMGMPARRRLLLIDLPLAWPVIITGMRVATQLLLGIAAIAAAVNGPGLGTLILNGLAKAGTPFGTYLAIEGIVGIVVLAILFDLGYVALNRLSISRGIRD